MSASLLCGKLIDETGDPLTPTHANKQGRRYRYYVSNRLTRARKDGRNGSSSGWRLPAVALEQKVAEATAQLVRSLLLGRSDAGTSIHALVALQKRLDAIDAGGDRNVEGMQFWCGLVATVQLQRGTIELTIDRDAVQRYFEAASVPPATDACWTVTAPFTLRRRGVEARLIIGNTGHHAIDQALIDNIARAHHVLDLLKAGNDYPAISRQTALSIGRIKQLLRMAFLAPDIVTDIMHGRQPVGLTSEWLQRNEPPLDWHRQRQRISLLR